MKNHLDTKVKEIVENINFIKNLSRKRFFCDMISSIIQCRSVQFYSMAEGMNKSVKTTSTERRIQHFFQKVEIDYEQLTLFLLSFFPYEKMTLSMDRTEWDYGKTQVNILCVVANIGKMALPLHFELLDNNSGNSNYQDRINLLEKLSTIIGKDRIKMLVMDREFIGKEWLGWLKQQQLPFCVRVPKHHQITFVDGSKEKATDLLTESPNCPIYLENVCVNYRVVNAVLYYDEDGEIVYLIGTDTPKELRENYKHRWSIEVFFQALKGRGFNMEESCLRCLKKYRKLFALVSVAYSLCWAAGFEKSKREPVKRKKHGYPQYSIFRRGKNRIVEYLQCKFSVGFIRFLDILIQSLQKTIIQYDSIQKSIG